MFVKANILFLIKSTAIVIAFCKAVATSAPFNAFASTGFVYNALRSVIFANVIFVETIGVSEHATHVGPSLALADVVNRRT